MIVKYIAAAALCLSALGSVAGAADTAPSADDIINAYLKAIGGKEAVEGIQSRALEGTVEILYMAIKAPITTYSKPPSVYTKIDIKEIGTFENGYTEGVAWDINPMEGTRILAGEAKAEMMVRGAKNEFLDWKSHFKEAKCTGESMVGETPCHTLEMTPLEGPVQTFHFDKVSGLLVQHVMENDKGYTITAALSDYKDVGALKFPHKHRNTGGEVEFEVTWSKVEINGEVPADKFVLPEAVRKLQENQAKKD
ncbi:MAG: hypothetical protein HYV27_02190 [Candidatus Hydrogenedentes bacterium]|nr:hypothetical protein [Candidatus Hydrogenedentota bacterium]